tara:strand:- start:142766 stop:143017 length:252 start_codon:yes stop_codon:yes gene_type:complete
MAVLTKRPRRLVKLSLVAIIARCMVVSARERSKTLPHIFLGVTVFALQPTAFVPSNALVISCVQLVGKAVAISGNRLGTCLGR